MSIAAFILGVSLYLPMKLLDQLIFDTTRTINLILLSATVSVIGLLVYISVSWVLSLEEITLFIKLAKKIVKVKQLFIEPTSEIASEGETQHLS